MALSELVNMALVREAVEAVTEPLEDPDLLEQIRLGEIVPSRKQLEELAKISTDAAVPLRNLIEELSKAGSALAHKVLWDDLVRIAGDAEAADEWRKGEQWPDTRQSHEKLIAAAAQSNSAIATMTASVVDVVPTTASAHADLFARIDNVIAALAEVRSRADLTRSQIALGTRVSPYKQVETGASAVAASHKTQSVAFMTDVQSAGNPTWVEATLQVLPEDGTGMHVREILLQIREHSLRNLTNMLTPENTLRRDLRQESLRERSLIVQVGPATFARYVQPTL
jgi:hypothetical protein